MIKSRPLQAHDIAHMKGDSLVRIMRVGESAALIRRYGDDRAPMGYEPLANLRLSTRLTLLLDDQDIVRLREVRRLTFAANEDFRPRGWGVTEKALGAHLRAALRVFTDNYCDEFAEDDLFDARQVPSKRKIPFRVRVPVDLRAALFATADDMRRSVDDLARVAIVQHVQTCHDGAPLAAMDPALRLCVYPPRLDGLIRDFMAERSAETTTEEPGEQAPEPPALLMDNRVSVDVLAETIAERNEQPRRLASAPWGDDGDGIRSVTSAAPPTLIAPPAEKPKIRPEDILAMRPLKPPGRP